jgi:hypothetical protein
MTNRVSNLVGISLVGVAILFGIVGLLPLGYDAWVRYSWNPTSAVVTAIRLTSLTRYGGVISIEFHSTGGVAHFSKAVLPGRTDRMVRNYAEGTPPLIY